MPQPPLAIVRAWQEKSLEVSVRSKDRLFVAVSKGFEALAALLAKDSDPADIQQALAYLNVDRAIALQFDKAKDDSLRVLVYGLLESMHVSLNEWNEERNQRKETGEIFTQTEEYTIPFLGPIIPSYEASLPMDNQTSNNLPTAMNPSQIEPKQEPIDIHQSLPQEYQISASELMRDEEMIMKEEMDNQYSDPISPDSLDCISTIPSLLLPPPSIIPPQEAVSIDFVHPSENMSTMGNFTPSNPKMKNEEPVDTQDNDNEINIRNSMGEEHNDNVMQPSDFMDNSMNFDDEAHDDGRDSLVNDLICDEGEEEEEAMGAPDDTTMDDSETANVVKRKRSSRHVPRPTKYADSMDDDDGGPSMKKSRSDSTRKDDKKRKSIKGEEKSEYVSKKPNVSKENATDLECPECEFSTRIVRTWITHLRNKHSTSPDLAGLVLLCECGHESLSEKHSVMCNHGNTTVILKRDGPIGRLDDEKTTPQCVLCEVYPRTACGYAQHLYKYHKSNLVQNGIYLMCSCGLEVRSNKSYKHLDECNPRQFTLHKLDDE